MLSRRPFSASRRRSRAAITFGLEHVRTLGDLLVDMLAPGLSSWSDTPKAPEQWKSFECLMLQNVALELRVINRALSAGDLTTEPPCDELATEDACRALQLLSHRAEAGADAAGRVRVARWGNPHFGGGEKASPDAPADSATRLRIPHATPISEADEP